VTATPIGNSLDLTVLRDGKERHVSVVVADLAQLFPEQFGGKSAEPNMPTEGTQARFGISIENLSPDRQKNMNLKEPGVMISEVMPGSFAEDIGMLANDVLTAINRQPVKSVDDVKRIQSTLKSNDAVAFRVLRKGRGSQDWQALYLAGTLPSSAQ
jgi:serine protease Do